MYLYCKNNFVIFAESGDRKTECERHCYSQHRVWGEGHWSLMQPIKNEITSFTS